MREKTIITAAVTGSIHTPTMSPYLPVTPQQIADEAVAACEARASAVVHVHGRNPETGQPSPDLEVMREIVRKIKAPCNAVICITTGGGLSMTVAQRVAPVTLYRPEMASLNGGSMNFALFPALDKFKEFKHDWEPQYLAMTEELIFPNTFKTIREFCRIFLLNETAKLFRWPGLRHAVINLDDAFGARLAASVDRTKVDVLGYGFGKGEITGHKLDLSQRGLRLEIETPWGPAAVQSRLLGGFNAANLLGVLGVLLAAGIELDAAARALAELEPVAGRLEMLREPGKPLVVVDYAHSPDALQKVLETLRALLEGSARLICVFGCGGERDAGKRPINTLPPRHQDTKKIYAYGEIQGGVCFSTFTPWCLGALVAQSGF